MKRLTYFLTISAVILAFSLKAQVAINQDGSDADANAILDVKSGPTSSINSFFINKTTGNIGIRTLTPASPLQFVSPGDDVWLMQWDNNDAANGAPARFRNTNSSCGNRVLMGATYYNGSTLEAAAVIGISIDSISGDAGIGVKGHANHEDAIGVYGSVSGSGLGWAGYFVGDVVSNNYYVFSDRRLKSNLNSIKNAINIIKKIKPYSFYYNIQNYPEAGLPIRLSYGFIAQDIEKVLPSLVDTKKIILNSNETISTDISANQKSDLFKVVNYTEMIPILTQAIKEQQELIENLEQRIIELESKVNNQ